VHPAVNSSVSAASTGNSHHSVAASVFSLAITTCGCRVVGAVVIGNSVNVRLHKVMVRPSDGGEAVLLPMFPGKVVLGKEDAVHARGKTEHVGGDFPVLIVVDDECKQARRQSKGGQ